MINVNVQSSIRDIQNSLEPTRQNIVDKAVVQAMNRAGTTMKNSGAQEVKKVYSSLRITLIKGYFRLEKAKKGRLEVKIRPKGGRLPLTLFSTLEWKARGGGVSVVLGNENVFIKSAFIRKRGANRNAVFIRADSYSGTLYNKGQVRQKRVSNKGNDLPIAELFARSIPEVILRNGIDKTLVNIGEERFSVEFDRQLRFYLSQIKSSV